MSDQPSNNSSSDKLYLLIILGMIGYFIYWYQTHFMVKRSNNQEMPVLYCKSCRKKLGKKPEKKIKKIEEESCISLDSVNSDDSSNAKTNASTIIM